MNWQEKVKAYKAWRRISWRALAQIIGITDTALGSALKTDGAWETVRTAIRLANEMGTTVEYLFDAETDWPPEPLIRPASAEERRLVIGVLERLKAADALERLAGGSRQGSPPPVKRKGKKAGRRSK